MSKKSIAVCYIATGPYIKFFEQFRESARKYFLPEFDRHFFVWSDTKVEECEDTTYIKKKWEKWPDAAIGRFGTFLTMKDELLKYDYVCFFNANSKVARDIHEDDIIDPELPFSSAVHMEMAYMDEEGKRNWLKNNYWSNEPESPAFLELEELVDSYGGWLMGGFQLGRSKDFMEMCETTSVWVNYDKDAGRRLNWHDEPYFNRYAIDHGVKRLTPEFLYPEGYDIPAKENPAIVIIDKNRVIGRTDFRHHARQQYSLVERAFQLMQKRRE